MGCCSETARRKEGGEEGLGVGAKEGGATVDFRDAFAI